MTSITKYASQAPGFLQRWTEVPATDVEAAGFCRAVYKRLAPALYNEELDAIVAGRGYTFDELCYAASRLPFDAEASKSIEVKTTNPYFLLAHVERIISEARLIRQLLTRSLNQFELSRLLMKVPELRPEDFQRCGYDGDGIPLVRYAPGIKPSAEAKEMQNHWGT